jgi:hypothetical protein
MLNKTKLQICCTNGFKGDSVFYHKNNLYDNEIDMEYLKYKFKLNHIDFNNIPNILNMDFFKIYNFCIESSILIKKSLLIKYNNSNNNLDNYWINLFNITNCLFINNNLFYHTIKNIEYKYTIEIMGGLGNQLFQIFTLLSYCKDNNKNFYFENNDIKYGEIKKKYFNYFPKLSNYIENEKNTVLIIKEKEEFKFNNLMSYI